MVRARATGRICLRLLGLLRNNTIAIGENMLRTFQRQKEADNVEVHA